MKINYSLLILTALLFSLVSCYKKDKTTSIKIEPTCLNTQSVCKIDTQFGPLFVLFNQKKITPEEKFSIFVGNKLISHNVNVSGFIEGKTMYMGKIPLFFSSEKQQHYAVADALLGSCSDKKMVWLLQLTIGSGEDNNQKEYFTIEFTSNRD